MDQDTAKTYTSRSTSPATMEISPIKLRETNTTRLWFYPKWVHESGSPLRGGFLFQKKSPLGEWEIASHQPLTALKKDEAYSLTLSGEEIIRLISELENINSIYRQEGFRYGAHSVRVIPDNVDAIFIQIADPAKKQMVQQSLQALNPDQIRNLDLVVKSVNLDKIIAEFEINMANEDEDFWQKFFGDNPEILQYVFAFPVIYLQGETYVGGKNTKGRQGSGGVATDHLIKNGSNGSFGVIEIKTPGCSLVGSIYRGKEKTSGSNEVYSIHGDLTGGLIQMENQIYVATDYFRTQLGVDYPGLNLLNPCGVLVAGNRSKLTQTQERSFSLFRKTIGKNQIYTFDEVLAKIKLIREIL